MQRLLQAVGLRQPGPKITAQDRAILDLKHQRDKVKQYQKRLQGILDREHEIAKECLRKGQKDRALVALRRRKYQEGLLSKTDSQLENLEQLVSTIEFSLIEVSVLDGLKQGNEVLKQIHKEMNIESVEKLLDETQEAQAYQREIDEMLMSQMTADEEDAVQEELAELERQAIEAKVPSVPLEVRLPDAPNVEPENVEVHEHAPPEPARERVAMAA
ncbi:Snf7-domain-containing protein [Auriculariales sp. MPI-PUGE-AT-0066]|nr:Snf7-domain-containing protein [Auriculariales sp. MPI-PUGE-AT-0066]